MTNPTALRSVPDTPAPERQPPPGRVLRIVAGLHAGASRGLAEQEMLVVGSGDDCDIVLADTGVAAHHALITLVGGVFTLRALDAPVRIEGKPLHPGDPVEVRALQRIDLGEAAIAFGGQDESAWDALFPAIADKSSKSRTKPLLRRLPLIAASAVLALAAVAVIAAMIPRRDDRVDVQAYLQTLVPQHGILQSKISTDVNGVPVLSGTVESRAMRDRIQQQLRDSGVNASLALNTGEDLAIAVREVFRMSGVAVDTKYLGQGTVEINGSVEQAKFKDILSSRAMAEVGEVKLVPGQQLSAAAGLAGDEKASDKESSVAAQAPVDIVAVSRGREPYVTDSNGVQYPDGALIPGHGKFVGIGIGNKIYISSPDGEIKQVRVLTAAEIAARAAAENGSMFSNVVSGPGAAQGPGPQRAVHTAPAKMEAAKK